MHRKVWVAVLIASASLSSAVAIGQQPVRWEPTLDSAQRLAAQTNKLVLIHFWAPWCGYCKAMEVKVLGESSVAAELAADYVAVKVNVENFPSTAKQYGVSALPTTVIASPQGQMLASMRGQVDTAEYLGRLRRVAADARQRSQAMYAQAGARPQPTAPTASIPAQQPIATAQPQLTGTNPLNATQSQPSPVDNRPNLDASAGRGARYANSSVPTTATTAASQATLPVWPGQNSDSRQSQSAVPVAPISQPQSAMQPPNGYQTPAATPAMLAYRSAPAATQMQNPAVQPQQPAVPNLPGAPPLANGPSAQSAAINPPLGLDGFCPVSLCEQQPPQWIVGDRRWGYIHRGRTYLFAGPEQQKRFFADPDRYAPAVSGNDIVMATEQGQAVPGMREHGVFFANRIYLFANEANLEKFARTPNLFVGQAATAVHAQSFAGQPLR